MAKEIELRRHTDNDGDTLTPEGVGAAVSIGRSLRGGYRLAAASPARRAVQTVGCLLAGLGEEVPDGVIVKELLRSEREDEWRSAYSQTGKGDLASFRDAAPALVEEDSANLARGLVELFGLIEEGERILAVGHSPTSEAAVLGLTGEIIDPLGKGEAVVVSVTRGEYSATGRLDP
jgi:broad specificity phosphatase PhoE